LKGSNCPHYDGEKERRPSYHKFILSGVIKNGIATDDGVAIHFLDQELIN
jgi:dipeptidase E